MPLYPLLSKSLNPHDAPDTTFITFVASSQSIILHILVYMIKYFPFGTNYICSRLKHTGLFALKTQHIGINKNQIQIKAILHIK